MAFTVQGVGSVSDFNAKLESARAVADRAAQTRDQVMELIFRGALEVNRMRESEQQIDIDQRRAAVFEQQAGLAAQQAQAQLPGLQAQSQMQQMDLQRARERQEMFAALDRAVSVVPPLPPNLTGEGPLSSVILEPTPPDQQIAKFVGGAALKSVIDGMTPSQRAQHLPELKAFIQSFSLPEQIELAMRGERAKVSGMEAEAEETKERTATIKERREGKAASGSITAAISNLIAKAHAGGNVEDMQPDIAAATEAMIASDVDPNNAAMVINSILKEMPTKKTKEFEKNVEEDMIQNQKVGKLEAATKMATSILKEAESRGLDIDKGFWENMDKFAAKVSESVDKAAADLGEAVTPLARRVAVWGAIKDEWNAIIDDPNFGVEVDKRGRPTRLKELSKDVIAIRGIKVGPEFEERQKKKLKRLQDFWDKYSPQTLEE